MRRYVFWYVTQMTTGKTSTLSNIVIEATDLGAAYERFDKDFPARHWALIRVECLGA